jgi:peptide/nickel transport system substrate-binding protein/oligopeptide transport system substrate-binding protein
VVGVVVVAAVLAAGGLSAPMQKGGTLRLSSILDVDSVDPALAYVPRSWMLEYATCAKLYNYPDKPAPQGAIAVPEVATSFPRVSADGKTQTIQLRRTFRFNTGQRVTAANYVAALNRDANPKLESPATNYLHEIVGADAVIDGRAQTISGVRALGPYTLRVQTTRLLPDLVYRLTMPFFCPIAVNTPPQEIDDPLGSGPYYVASRVPNRQVVLARNRFYRGSRPANADQIVLTVGVGQAACEQAVEQDQLDWCEFLPPTAPRELAAQYGINKSRFFFNPELSTFSFAFNHDRPAFKGLGQIPLAQAINWAIDRPAMVRAAGYLGGKRTDQILPPAFSRPTSIYPLGGVTEESLARAQALLRRAKLKPDKLVLYTGNLPLAVAAAQIFQFNLRRLGIDVEIKYFPPFTLFMKLGRRGEPFDVGFNPWGADYPDGSTYFQPLLNGDNITSRGNQNFAYFDRPTYNREIERIDGLSGAARRRAWADLDVEMMRDDPPWAPFMNSAQDDFVSASYGCYVFQPAIGRPDIAAACKR